MANRRRNKLKSFTLTEEEYIGFHKKLQESGRTQQDYVLEALVKDTVRSSEEIKELEKIGLAISDYAAVLRKIEGKITRVLLYNQEESVDNLTDLLTAVKEVQGEVQRQWHIIVPLMKK